MMQQCCQAVYAFPQPLVWPQLSQESYDLTLHEESVTIPVVDSTGLQSNTDPWEGCFRNALEDEIERSRSCHTEI
jgi:hypothetical protein